MKKVVLIEDSKTLAGALTGALELEGVQTVWAADGVQGGGGGAQRKAGFDFAGFNAAQAQRF